MAAMPQAISDVSSHHYAPVRAALPQVLAELGYLLPTGQRPQQYAYTPPEGTPWESAPFENRVTAIADARHLSAPISVHREGFELWDAPSALRDFSDAQAIADRYYPELAELACAVTGARRAYVFDHLVRKRESDHRALDFGRAARGETAAANGRIHNDYTEASGLRRLAMVLEGRQPPASVSRYAIVNIWRSIRGPVLDTPLAVCDARTLGVSDLVEADVHYPKRRGEIYLVTHAPRHRWSYFSAMDRHEALVFKQYDSQLGGVARFVPHAAFDHPHAPAGTPPRESIEARCLVLFD